ncbi:phosphatidylserine decarboxylase family protein [Polaribacter sp.]|nr:phosphatidylserine decarboxylase family protein [Polaribacter sp.]
MKNYPNYRVGKWLPSDQKTLENWIQNLIDFVEDNPQTLVAPVQSLKDLIESSEYYTNLFTNMFTEVPTKYPYNLDPTGEPQVRDYNQMLDLINAIMSQPPEYNNTGLVGFPINAILDWSMGTVAGYIAFIDPQVNDKFKAILQYWGDFLTSNTSASILNTSPTGWLNNNALNTMCAAAYGTNFLDIFNCPSNNINDGYGFQSWDAFFTRTFKSGVRPVAGSGDSITDPIIANACESAPYQLKTNVQANEQFWIKGQPYSLTDMLANDELTSSFVGGTVYQAFLNALSYHRWHSPISGTIKKAYVVDGTYYSENYYQGFSNPDGPDNSAPNDSQAYITEVATRAIIFIEADNPNIGLMCFMAVGMAEVSSNEITVSVNQHVTKGEQLGMFHFGGSTHCLFFRPEVNLAFDFDGQNPNLNAENIKLSSKIAQVFSSTPTTQSFTISASSSWQNTGVEVSPTSFINVAYEKGLWTANPNITENSGLYDAGGNLQIPSSKTGYTLPGKPEGALIGKVGSTIFFIGSYATLPPNLSGNLELCINDDLEGLYGPGLTDNLGEVTVSIRIES